VSLFDVGGFTLPSSGGTTSLALRFLTGDGSSGLMGDDWYATTREPPGVEMGALVAWGSAGRGCREARLSRGWVSEEDAMRPTPAGVGVKGGGLVGDFDAAILRFFGSGVAGRDGTAQSVSFDVALGSSSGAVVEALVLRFLGAGAAFSTFVYLPVPFVAVDSGIIGTLLLATRAERLGDILR
jgi:hypothetical protein